MTGSGQPVSSKLLVVLAATLLFGGFMLQRNLFAESELVESGFDAPIRLADTGHDTDDAVAQPATDATRTETDGERVEPTNPRNPFLPFQASSRSGGSPASPDEQEPDEADPDEQVSDEQVSDEQEPAQ